MNSNYSTSSSPSLPGNISSALNGLVGAGQGALGNSGWNDYQQKAMDAASFGLDQGTNNMGQASYTAHDLTGFWNPAIGASQAGLTTLGRGDVRDIGAFMTAPGSVSATDVTAGTLPGVDLSQYMNPYIQNVVNSSMGELNRQGDIDQQRLNGNAALSGAFGGDRAAITNTEAARNLEQTKAQTLGSLYSQGYNTATGLAQTDLARLLQASGMNQQAGLQAGIANQNTGLQSQIANQNADLAAQKSNQGADLSVGTLNTNSANQMAEYNANLAHQAQVANQQNGLSSAALRLNAANSLGNLGYQWAAARGGRIPGIARADGGRIPRRALGGTLFREGTAMQELPLLNLAALARIYGSLPYGSLTTQTQNRPGPSMLAQGAGLGTTIAGLLGQSGAFGKNGWLASTGNGDTQQQDPWTAAGVSPPVPGIKPAEFGNQDLNGTLQVEDVPADAWNSPDYGQYAARGGRINHARGGIARFADGGDTRDYAAASEDDLRAWAQTGDEKAFDALTVRNNPTSNTMPVAPGESPIQVGRPQLGNAIDTGTTVTAPHLPSTPAAEGTQPFFDDNGAINIKGLRENIRTGKGLLGHGGRPQGQTDGPGITGGGGYPGTRATPEAPGLFNDDGSINFKEARRRIAADPAPLPLQAGQYDPDALQDNGTGIPAYDGDVPAPQPAGPAKVALQPGRYDPNAPIDDPNAVPPYSPLIAAPKPSAPRAGIAAAPPTRQGAPLAGLTAGRPMAVPAGLPSVAPTQVSGVTPPSVGAPSAARPRAGIAAAPYKPDIWMPLAQAGAAMMASQSPFALSAIGEGAQAGLKGYQDQRQLAATMGLKQAQMGLNERRLANQEDATAGRNKYFNDKLDVMRNRPGTPPRVQIAADGTSYTVNAQGQAVPLLDAAGQPVMGHVPNAQQTRPYAKTPVQTDQGLMLFDPNDGKLSPATANGQALQRTSPVSAQQTAMTPNQLASLRSRIELSVNNNPLIKAADKQAMIEQQYNNALTAGGMRPAAAPQQTAAPPPGAVEYLRAHPELRGQFEQKFGPGSASRILGQ